MPGPEIELVCRSEEIKEGQDVARDRMTIEYLFVPTSDELNAHQNHTSRSLTGGRKHIHSALILTRDKRRMYSCSEINDYNIELYLNKPHRDRPKTERIWQFDHQLYENRER